jgi:predicted transcriptional regulator
MMIGCRQSELAAKVGISASYLNLIEHNRRRIGGKILVDIASALGVDPGLLTEGAEAALISSLREATDSLPESGAELDRIDEFTGRFPGWAEVLAQAQRRISSLERLVETLSDRLTHDPNLAMSLHEVLSTAAAIRSTAAILAETDELEPKWRERFHQNLNKDSARLSDSSKALVRYLDDTTGADAEDRRSSPREEAEAMFAAHGYHFPQLEDGSTTPSELVAKLPELKSQAARSIAANMLAIYRADAVALPLQDLQAAIGKLGLDVDRLARAFDQPLDAILRRLAALPSEMLDRPVGLVVCDTSGAFLFRRPVDGFSLPQFGASCPLWPLFSAQSRPAFPIRRLIRQFGRGVASFECFAIAVPEQHGGFNTEPLYRATMLLVPVEDDKDTDVLEVGTNCRVCQKDNCAARREPSILGDQF